MIEKHRLRDCLSFSVHRGILVLWDLDEDERVLALIDMLPDKIRSGVIAIQERKAGLNVVVRDLKTEWWFKAEGEFEEPFGDIFVVNEVYREEKWRTEQVSDGLKQMASEV